MDQVIIELLGTIVTVVVSIATLAYWLGRKFAEIDGRFRQIDDRFKEINERIDEVEKGLNKRIDEVAKGLNDRIDRLAVAMFNVQSLLVEFMSIKGLFTTREAEFLVHEIGRSLGAVKANPIKKEDLEFIKSVFAKRIDDMTIEELDRVIEIAKKWFMEDGEEIAVRVFQAAEIARAVKLYEKYKAEEEKEEKKQQTQ